MACKIAVAADDTKRKCHQMTGSGRLLDSRPAHHPQHWTPNDLQQSTSAWADNWEPADSADPDSRISATKSGCEIFSCEPDCDSSQPTALDTPKDLLKSTRARVCWPPSYMQAQTWPTEHHSNAHILSKAPPWGIWQKTVSNLNVCSLTFWNGLLIEETIKTTLLHTTEYLLLLNWTICQAMWRMLAYCVWQPDYTAEDMCFSSPPLQYFTHSHKTPNIPAQNNSLISNTCKNVDIHVKDARVKKKQNTGSLVEG